ncbi:MAG: hypothetical protein ACOYN4_16425 [Bacteroidales bacterium]
MKNKSTIHFSRLAFSILAGMFLLSGYSYAQDKPKENKTITIHVTKEEDGKITIIDTTVVTDTDFDADAFLLKKGVGGEKVDGGKQIEKKIVIVNPGTKSITYTEDEGGTVDTVMMEDGKIIVLRNKPDGQDLESMDKDMHFNFDMPEGFGHFQGPMCDQMLKGIMKEYGLDAFMPVGQMEKIVVKKKRNGKKVIITFEDREGACCGHEKVEKRIEYRD